MASCSSRSYPFNPALAQELCAKIFQESGIRIDPNSATGTEETHGVTINWTIAGGRIVFSIPSRPWVIPCSTIFSELDNLFGTKGE